MEHRYFPEWCLTGKHTGEEDLIQEVINKEVVSKAWSMASCLEVMFDSLASSNPTSVSTKSYVSSGGVTLFLSVLTIDTTVHNLTASPLVMSMITYPVWCLLSPHISHAYHFQANLLKYRFYLTPMWLSLGLLINISDFPYIGISGWLVLFSELEEVMDVAFGPDHLTDVVTASRSLSVWHSNHHHLRLGSVLSEQDEQTPLLTNHGRGAKK